MFGLPPLMDGHNEIKQRLASPALDWLRQIAIELERTSQLDVAFSTEDLVEISQSNGINIPGFQGRGAPEPLLGRALKPLFEGSPEQQVFVDHFLIQLI